MVSNCYSQLKSILSNFPHLYQLFADEFIKEQCKKGLKNYILKSLYKDNTNRTWQHLPTIERRLIELASVVGYDRLTPLLRGAIDLDEHQEVLSQIDITLWFKQKKLLKEIGPKLPHRLGNADALLSFSGQDIYCEITSFQSLAKSIKLKGTSDKNKVRSRWGRLKKHYPWLTEQDVENEIEEAKAVRILLKKTQQLPPAYTGILALDTSKALMFAHNVEKIACKLFPQRSNVALIGLWSGERGTQQGKPPFWYFNTNSHFKNTGQELLKYLGQAGKAKYL